MLGSLGVEVRWLAEYLEVCRGYGTLASAVLAVRL